MTERKVDLTEQVRKMQLDAAWLAGQSYERAAIVSWLRTQRTGWTTRVLDILADAIEAGEHCNTHTHKE